MRRRRRWSWLQAGNRNARPSARRPPARRGGARGQIPSAAGGRYARSGRPAKRRDVAGRAAGGRSLRAECGAGRWQRRRRPRTRRGGRAPGGPGRPGRNRPRRGAPRGTTRCWVAPSRRPTARRRPRRLWLSGAPRDGAPVIESQSEPSGITARWPGCSPTSAGPAGAGPCARRGRDGGAGRVAREVEVHPLVRPAGRYLGRRCSPRRRRHQPPPPSAADRRRCCSRTVADLDLGPDRGGATPEAVRDTGRDDEDVVRLGPPRCRRRGAPRRRVPRGRGRVSVPWTVRTPGGGDGSGQSRRGTPAPRPRAWRAGPELLTAHQCPSWWRCRRRRRHSTRWIAVSSPLSPARRRRAVATRPTTSRTTSPSHREAAAVTRPSRSPARPRAQRRGHDVGDVVDQVHVELSSTSAGTSSRSGPLRAGRKIVREPGPVGGQQLLLDPADGQHPAVERDLAGHPDVGAHRPPGDERRQRRHHRDARRRSVLRHRARREVHVHVPVDGSPVDAGIASAWARR